MTQTHCGDPGEILTTTRHMKIKSKVGMSGMNQDTAEITTGHNTNIKTDAAKILEVPVTFQFSI